MNVRLIARLFSVLCLSEFLLTRVIAFFFSSLVSSQTSKSNFPAFVKFGNENANFEDNAYRYPQQGKRKPHIIIILADDMVSEYLMFLIFLYNTFSRNFREISYKICKVKDKRLKEILLIGINSVGC